jgi:hypothetical protein
MVVARKLKFFGSYCCLHVYRFSGLKNIILAVLKCQNDHAQRNDSLKVILMFFNALRNLAQYVPF